MMEYCCSQEFIIAQCARLFLTVLLVGLINPLDWDWLEVHRKCRRVQVLVSE
jgi:hypothetical protein